MAIMSMQSRSVVTEVLLATGSGDTTARVWDVATGGEFALLSHEAPVVLTEFSPDGRYLATGCSDGTFRLWDARLESDVWFRGEHGESVRYLRAGEELLRLEHGGRAWDLAFSPDGSYLATVSSERPVQIWSTKSGREVQRLPTVEKFYDVAFGPEGDVLATAGAEGTARIWRLDDGTETIRLSHEDAVSTVAFSPDGSYLATGSLSTARIWETSTGRQVAEFVHERPINALVFSRDGRSLVTATGSSVVRAHPHLATVWDVASGRELTRIPHDEGVLAVAISPDGKYIASGSYDRNARLWLWRAEDLIQEGCARLTRNLSPEEWSRYIGAEPFRYTCPDLAAIR